MALNGPPRTQRRSLGRHGDCTIARGGELRDRGSIFTAQCAWPVKSVEAAAAAFALMRQDAVCASADHNMTAYRFVDAKSRVFKEYDDDGEVCHSQSNTITLIEFCDRTRRASERSTLERDLVQPSCTAGSRWPASPGLPDQAQGGRRCGNRLSRVRRAEPRQGVVLHNV